MNSETEEKLTINIDLQGLVDLLNSGVIRAYSAVCLSLNIDMLSEINLYPYKQHKPGLVPLQLLPDKLSPEQLTEHKEVFSQWVVGNALRELIEIFALYLDELYKAAFFVNERKKHAESMKTFSELNAAVDRQMKGFEGKGITDKLKELTAFNIATNSAEGLETFNIARNCLTHRAGIVGQGVRGDRDLNDGDNLTLKWRYVEIVYQFPDGTEGKWIEGEQPKLPAGTNIIKRNVDRISTTPIGERLILHPNEIGEICLNFLQAGNEIMASFEQFLRNNEVRFIETED